MDLNTTELNSLLNKISNHIKLCTCGSSSNDVNSSEFISSFASELRNDGPLRCLSLKESNHSEISTKNCILNKIMLKVSCPNCISDTPSQKAEIIRKMQNALIQTLLKTGIDFSSFMLPETIDDLNTTENDIFKIKCDAKYLKRNAKGETPLHTAAKKRELQSVQTMLRNEVNPNTQDNAGWTPLHEAVFDDNYEIAFELLSAGAIVNAPGFDFTTPLHIATYHNNLPMVRLLLEFGANPAVRDISNRTPESYATNSEIISNLNKYKNFVDIVEMTKMFQKKAAPRPIVIYMTPDWDANFFPDAQEVESLLNVKISKRFNKSVTHVVILELTDNVACATYDVLKAILSGCVIVNLKWLQACIEHKKILNFSEYEINGTLEHPTVNAARMARNNFLNLNPPLFTGCNIFLQKVSPLFEMKELVLAGGAKLLSREPNPEHAPLNHCLYHCPPGHSLENTSTLILYHKDQQPKLSYNMKHIKSLPVEWFYDCIQTFTIKEPSDK